MVRFQKEAIMNFIKVYETNTIEFQKLSTFKRLLNLVVFMYDLPVRIYLQNCYFDCGQDWKWTSMICELKNSSSKGYQLLSPKQYEIILYGDSTSIANLYEEIKSKLLQKYSIQ